jgi:hypothetical protein
LVGSENANDRDTDCLLTFKDAGLVIAGFRKEDLRHLHGKENALCSGRWLEFEGHAAEIRPALVRELYDEIALLVIIGPDLCCYSDGRSQVREGRGDHVGEYAHDARLPVFGKESVVACDHKISSRHGASL